MKINGNPRLASTGNISLSIRERDAPVSIAAGTKNLVLNAPLDREGRTGPASIYINVICIRRDNPDPVSDNFFVFGPNLMINGLYHAHFELLNQKRAHFHHRFCGGTHA